MAFTIALRELLNAKGKKEDIWTAIRNSKDPAIFVVLFEDAAALTGLIVAFLGVFLGSLCKEPRFDGLASTTIGIILAITAVFLAYESKGLLVGESAETDIIESIQSLVKYDPDIAAIKCPLTMHLSPDEVLPNLDIHFRPNVTGNQVARAVDRIEKAIYEKHPTIKKIFVEAQALRTNSSGG